MDSPIESTDAVPAIDGPRHVEHVGRLESKLWTGKNLDVFRAWLRRWATVDQIDDPDDYRRGSLVVRRADLSIEVPLRWVLVAEVQGCTLVELRVYHEATFFGRFRPVGASPLVLHRGRTSGNG